MRTVGLLFLIGISACWATLDSGAYELGDLLIRHAPSTKQDGRAWDPFGGAPDIYVSFYLQSGRTEEHLFNTADKEDCGSSAAWSSYWETYFSSDEIDDPDTFLFVKVWDFDVDADDFMDSGRIAITDLINGENLIECNYGTEVSFSLGGPLYGGQ
jgi:hypothetical protein